MSNLSSLVVSKNLQVTTSSGGGTGGVVVSGSAVTLDTVASLNAATIDAAVNYIRVAGYWTVGDPGAGSYRKKASSESDVPGDQTSNGGTIRWEIIPDNNELCVWRFGARNMPDYRFEPAPGSDDDAYNAFVRADKYILAKGLTGVVLHLGASLLYLSKAHNLKRVSYHIKGNYHGSMIRTPAYEDGILINYKWSTGRDATLYLNNFGYETGQACWKETGLTGEGNFYRCMVGGTSAATGDTLNGNDPTVTYTDGTCQFKFERYLGPNGTNPYDYCLDGVSAADNSVIENVQFWGFWDPFSSDPNRNKWPDQHGDMSPPKPQYGGRAGYYNCAIIERARAKLENIFVFQYPGFGIAIVADGDPDLTGPGNVNGYHNDHIFSYYNGKAGLHVGYSDANAGTTVYLDTAQNGRFGYEEFSFLGNYVAMHQSAFDGNLNLANKQYPSGCLRNGYAYIAKLPTLGINSWPAYINEDPATNSNAWTRWGGDGTLASGAWGNEYPDWTTTQRFEPGGGFASNNLNARNVMISMYIEGGTFASQPGIRDVVFGGLTQATDTSRGALTLNDNNWSFLSTNSLMRFNVGDGGAVGATFGIPTDVGTPQELRINYSGGAGAPWAYVYYGSAWHAQANRI